MEYEHSMHLNHKNIWWCCYIPIALQPWQAFALLLEASVFELMPEHLGQPH